MQVPPDYGHTTVTITSESPNTRADALNKTTTAATSLTAALRTLPLRELHLTQARAHAVTSWDTDRQAHVHTGWTATITITLTADAATLGNALSLAATHGANINWTQWHLDPENPARRETRKQAVTQARTAAQDFADALGLNVGELVSLADPGLTPDTPAPTARGQVAHAGGPFTAADVPLDPEPVTVSATVEATYTLASQQARNP